MVCRSVWGMIRAIQSPDSPSNMATLCTCFSLCMKFCSLQTQESPDSQVCFAAEFGAWYPRFSPVTAVRTWRNFVTDMKELFSERLRKSPASVLWRAYSPSHFGGDLGGYEIEGTPDEWPDSQLTSCQPASKGGWCSLNWMVSLIIIIHYNHHCRYGMLVAFQGSGVTQQL